MEFVIQKFKSSNGGPRYYLRLERDGVLKGWAVLPEKGKKQHRAIEVGPFKLSAAGFEGKVEKSKFGPGKAIQNQTNIKKKREIKIYQTWKITLQHGLYWSGLAAIAGLSYCRVNSVGSIGCLA